MWGVPVVIAIGAIIAAMEAPSIIRSKSWRVLAAFFATLCLGVALLIGLYAGIDIPSPLEPLRMIYEPIGKAIRGE